MKIFVYGTLKSGNGNNRIIEKKELIGEHVVEGYKLLDAGFPVAMPNKDTSISGEVWDIGDDTDVLNRLDLLESEGFMYDRKEIEPGLHMYVGNPKMWSNYKLSECPSKDGVYTWSR